MTPPTGSVAVVDNPWRARTGVGGSTEGGPPPRAEVLSTVGDEVETGPTPGLCVIGRLAIGVLMTVLK